MSEYPPPGAPPYYGPYPPPPPPHHQPPHPPPYNHPPHLPPGSFTYSPQAYSYNPTPHWQQPQTPQPYVQPTQPVLQQTPQSYVQLTQPALQQTPQSCVQPTQPMHQQTAQSYVQPTQPAHQQTPQSYVQSTQPALQQTSQSYVQPTQSALPVYETNVIQCTVVAEPTPGPKPVVTSEEDVISWVPATPTTAQTLEYKAVVGGREGYDWSPLWIIRAHHKGELIPGKLAIKHRYAFIPSAGKEVPVHNFEVLCSTNPAAVQWVSAKDGQVPASAIVAGNTLNADPLYIGKVPHKWSITPGKVQPNHGCCYISYGGKEISFKKYEVLCQIS